MNSQIGLRPYGLVKSLFVSNGAIEGLTAGAAGFYSIE